MLEFISSVVGGELPVGLVVVCIAIILPCGDFIDQGLFVGDTAIEALGGQDAEFGLGQIEPTAMFGGVVPLEAFDQSAGFGGGKGLVE